MSHNVNRKPNYPTEEKKGKKRTPKTVLEGIKNGWYWLCFIAVVGLLIWIPCKITYNQIQRQRVNKNPVETEAVITGFGKPIYRLGTPVYFEYRVGDSVYTDDLCQTSKTLKKLHVGQTIHIKYENGNPSNAIWDYTKKI